MTTALTKPEKSVLAELEAEIERGLNNFVDVGNAFLRIRNERLYRAEFGSFQEYCEAKWQMTKVHAYRMIDAAEIAENLKGNQLVTPTTESQLRPLRNLEPVQQREVWKEAADTAKKPGAPTAKEVKLIIDKVTKPERINYVPSNGLQYADMAITSLEKIQPNDTQRSRAFNKVTNWIAQQESTK